jgi:hypothetical protein
MTHDADDPSDDARLVFPFAFEPLFRVLSAPFGVSPGRARVEVDHDTLIAVFGPWRVETPLANVEGVELTGPYSAPKVIGPAHVSLADRGLTFASNPHKGVCIKFHEPVTGIDPVGWIRHPALTVTVAEPPVLAALLDRAHHEDRVPGLAEEVTVENLTQEVSDDLHAMTAAELRTRAREMGLRNVSKMKKAELIEALRPG